MLGNPEHVYLITYKLPLNESYMLPAGCDINTVIIPADTEQEAYQKFQNNYKYTTIVQVSMFK